jgi:nucleolar protein 58
VAALCSTTGRCRILNHYFFSSSNCSRSFTLQVSDEKKLAKTDADDIFDTFFKDSKTASKYISLLSFQPFEDTADAVTAATSLLEGKVSKTLKSFLKKKLKKAASSSLAVAEKSLGVSLKEALSDKNQISIVHDNKTNELFRGLRCYMEELFDTEGGMSAEDLRAMQLGLSHSLSRYKLKFSADKVDTMVVQGWHFPELQAILSDNAQYAKLVLKCGMRPNFGKSDLSDILDDETLENAVKEAAEVSMGTEVAELDIINIQALAEQVLSMTEYRAQLFEYLKNRMNAIAPNLTILVGELVGARLIAHAGSLMNLAKQPASTVQILGAEKALFRALKTKHDTPKYGLIYHASLVGQAAPKNKGKISRVLAAKAALGIRVDALSDETTEEVDTSTGYEGRAKVEARLRQLEGGSIGAKNGNLKAKKTAKYDPVAAKTAAAAPSYNDASDMMISDVAPEIPSDKKKKKKDKKRKSEGDVDNDDEEKSSKKRKLEEGGDEKFKKSEKKKKKKKSE